MHWSDKHNLLIANSDGATFKVTDENGTFSDLTGEVNNNRARMTYAEQYSGSDALVLMANGGRIAYTDTTAVTQYISDADAPTAVTHIGMLDLRLIANNVGTNTFSFSNANNPLAWTASDNYDAESQVDDIEALFVANRRIYLAGKNSIETWYNAGDPNDPLIRRLTGAYVENGVYSAETLNTLENNIVFLDNRRRLAIIDGDSYSIRSSKFNKFIQSLAYVEDAYTTHIRFSGKTLLLIGFPQEGKTIIYDNELDVFYNWGTWNEETQDYDAFKCNCFAHAKTWNKNLIGDPQNGIIYELTEDAMTDNGIPIRLKINSGHINYGSDSATKYSKSLIARLKRGATTDYANEPKLLIRKNDNGSKRWSNWHEVGLGLPGDYEFVKTLYGKPSTYNTRQFEIVCADPIKLVIAGLFEDVEVRK